MSAGAFSLASPRVDETAQRPNDLWTPYLMEGRALSGPNLLGTTGAVVPPVSPSRLLVTDYKMDDAIGRGDEEAVKILA